MAYNEIRPIALRINPDLGQLPCTFETLCFPEEWKRSLIKMQSEANQRKSDETSLPIRDLNKTMRALVPDLISIDPYAGRIGERIWLRSGTRSASSEALRLLMYWWGKFSFAKVAGPALSNTLNQLTVDQLVWNSETLDLANWDTYPNGTAKHRDEAQYSVLPDLIASKLSHQDAAFELHERNLNFFRVPISPGGKGAELISWPPLDSEILGQRYYYSILVTITVQTLPFQAFPAIHLDFGVRRWVSLPTKIAGGETSVYLRSHVPWIEGIQQSNSFQVAPIRWIRTESGPALVWSSYLTNILNQVNPIQVFQVPTELADNPVAGMNIGSTPNAAIVYRNALKPKHFVQPGLMPSDRKPLTEQIAALLAPDFVLINSLQLVSRPPAPDNPFTAKVSAKEPEVSEDLLAARHAMISSVTNKAISLEIYYQKPETLQVFRDEISELLGLQLPSQLPAILQPSDLTITVNARPLGAIGDALKLDAKIGNPVDRAYQAITLRKDFIGKQLADTTQPTVAFIELANADAFEDVDDEDDPKRAIRAGFAHVNRHTQFIDRDSEESIKERVKKSLLDGFRQLGVHRYLNTSEGLPQGWNYAGIWLIRQSRDRSPARTQQFIPVIVFIDGNDGKVSAIAPGMDDWMSYADTLLAIGQGKVSGYDNRKLALPFIQEKLENDVVPQGNTLLLCDAQNLRQTWPWLGNARISVDSLTFGEENPRPASDWPGLRVVRVRNSDQHETPEWYAEKGDDFGFSKGLFRMGNRVFASTYGKASQFKKVSKNMSILDFPSATSWNPGLYELTVAAIQPGDDVEKIVGFAHSLRNVSIQYDDATALPLPLHLAKLMEEYVLILTFELDDESVGG
ncbi:MAG: DUF3962 domain-containing protein [Anaerolineae bacterium]|nr:DUF3962 domain-containing protein [Anaerolineae bacterium]